MHQQGSNYPTCNPTYYCEDGPSNPLKRIPEYDPLGPNKGKHEMSPGPTEIKDHELRGTACAENATIATLLISPKPQNP